jgi:hypothetical protein
LTLSHPLQLHEERIRALGKAELFVDVDRGSVAACDMQKRYVAVGEDGCGCLSRQLLRVAVTQMRGMSADRAYLARSGNGQSLAIATNSPLMRMPR